MDIPVTVLLGVAFIWIALQEFVGPGSQRIHRGVPIISALILATIVAVDWFVGRRAILGHPDGFVHTVFKMILSMVVIVSIGSGLTAIRTSRNTTAIILNTVWSVALITLCLKFLGAWSIHR